MSRKRAPSVPITLGERAQFSFLFDRLDEKERSNLEEILDRLKAAGRVDLENLDRLKPSGPVSPNNLSALLMVQFALDGFDSVGVREWHVAFVEDVVRFDRARKKLQKYGHLLDAPALGVRPPAFQELLDALSRAIHEGAQRWRRMLEMDAAREKAKRRPGKKVRRPLRETVALPPGIARDDARELLRLTRLAAKNTPPGGWTITYGMPPPCPQCGNPAPLLFRRK